jgi:c-di-GMP-binding flagellar brake protein YcgR
MAQAMNNTQQELYLGIEPGVLLQLQLEGVRGSYKSTLVGMERGLYLISRIPQMPGLKAKLGKEDQVIVRYLYEGTAYGFRSMLLGVTNEPFRLAFLSYPENIEVVNLRTQERVSCFFPAVLSLNESSWEGVILDVSPGGCNFVFDPTGDKDTTGFNIGDVVLLSTQITGSSGPMTLRGTIRNIRQRETEITLGTQFHEVEPLAIDAITRYADSVRKFATTARK